MIESDAKSSQKSMTLLNLGDFIFLAEAPNRWWIIEIVQGFVTIGDLSNAQDDRWRDQFGRPCQSSHVHSTVIICFSKDNSDVIIRQSHWLRDHQRKFDEKV